MRKYVGGKNYVPNTVNKSPDYYCTWQTQLYATNDGKPEMQKKAINERSLFDTSKPNGWAYFYENARRDLIFVLDSGWDVPYDDNPSKTCRGSHILSVDKFPSFAGDGAKPPVVFKRLADKLMSLGWKGVGGWIASNECDRFVENGDAAAFWRTRFEWVNDSGMAYWKVDNGYKRGDSDFRKRLAEAAHRYAPKLFLENAVKDDVIPYSDVFRTYDVPAIMSIPMTLEKIYDKRNVAPPAEDFKCLLNCEDEAYIAAALGFTMGIMRHPYTGCFMNGKADMSFPEMHRNLKTKLTEVTRAARWHRIAPAYAFDSREMKCSEAFLSDTWNIEVQNDEIEEWWFAVKEFNKDVTDNTVIKSAPAVISRNISLPEVVPDSEGRVPYVIASKNPNGVVSCATLGRTEGRVYGIPKCDVTLDAGDSDTFGIFGEYRNITLKTGSDCSGLRVFAQDLADDTSYNITESVCFDQNGIVIPGHVIHEIGTISQPDGDTSEPGVLIKISKEE